MNTQVGERDVSVVPKDTYSGLGHIIADLQNLRAASEHDRNRDKPVPQLPSRETVISVVDGLVGRRYDPWPDHHRPRLGHWRQCLAHAKRAAGKQHHQAKPRSEAFDDGGGI
jgi:hypothetical protein